MARKKEEVYERASGVRFLLPRCGSTPTEHLGFESSASRPHQHRIGGVVVRAAKDYGARAFAKPDTDGIYFIPPKEDYDDQTRLNYEDFSRQAELPRAQKVLHGLTTATLLPAGFAVPEAWGGAWWQQAVGLGASGVAAAMGHKKAQQVRLAHIDGLLSDIDDAFKNPLDHVVLPYDWRSEKMSADFLAQEFEVNVHEMTFTYTYGDVVQQLYQTYRGDSEITEGGHERIILNKWRGASIHMRTDSERFELAMRFMNNDEENRAAKLVRYIAARLKKQDSDNVHIDYIPAEFLEDMLFQAKDPDELYSEIAPRLKELSITIEAGNVLARELKQLRKVKQTTGSTNEEALRGAKTESMESRQEQLRQVLQIAAIGLKLNEGPDTWLRQMQKSHEAGDNVGMGVALVDAVHAAFTERFPDNSSDSKEYADRIGKALDALVPLLAYDSDVTEHVWRRLRKEFPELALPEEMPR